MKEELSQEQKDESKERLDLVVPIAQEIIKIIAKYPVVIGDIAKEDREQEYRDIVKEVVTLLVDKDINYTDRKFIFQLVLQAYDSVANQVNLSLEKGFEMASKKLFGKDLFDIKLSDLDAILKE